MGLSQFASWSLEQEARGLLTRLSRVKPFALHESMLPAANLLPASQIAIEYYLIAGRRSLRAMLDNFLRWLRSSDGASSDAEEAQRKFTLLRLRFNAVLTQFDLFENVVTQRSENETGVWLSGLDVVSADALRLRGDYYESPSIICYLDRGVGAAIRRARTRLPGGGSSPVAVIKVPRERMVGTGIASSLIHEVGHQAAALLGLVESLQPVLRGMARGPRPESLAWDLWRRWISEIIADFWSVARAGVASTMGLMGVVSLPRAFVFRLNVDDPHPMPWIRVKLSAAIGKALYPQPVWDRLTQLWESFYPREGLTERQKEIVGKLEETMPALVALLIHHRPGKLRGKTLTEALDTQELQPDRLRGLLQRWRLAPQDMYLARPILVFAALGQGRADGTISPEEESTVLGKILAHWALWSTLQAASGCVNRVKHSCSCKRREKSIQRNFSITRRQSYAS